MVNMKARPALSGHRNGQRGFALFTAAMFLLLLLVLALAVARAVRQEEAISGNTTDSRRAFECAEAAMADGRAFVRSPSYSSGAMGVTSTETLMSTSGVEPFGLSYWRDTFAWSSTTGRALTLSDGLGGLSRVTNSCFYVIEKLTDSTVRDPSTDPITGAFRVTARGVGGRSGTVSFLQSTFFATN